MTTLLKGKPIADLLTEKLARMSDELKIRNIIPTLATVMIGGDPSDLAYERGLKNRATKVGGEVRSITLSENTTTAEVVATIQKLNEDENIHGILIFRPMPAHIDDEIVRNTVVKDKDIDGVSDMAMASVYANSKNGYAPCTAEACVEILRNHTDLQGKNVVVIGRSLVIGKPVAMMLLQENSTVTICHSRTENLHGIASKADILITALGKPEMIDASYTNGDQIIIDVGINFTEEGKMVGDVDFANVDGKVKVITPVPGGVGAVTSTILWKHVIESAMKG